MRVVIGALKSPYAKCSQVIVATAAQHHALLILTQQSMEHAIIICVQMGAILTAQDALMIA